MTSRRPADADRARWAIAAGLLVAAAAQLLAPLPGPPLYDGVVPAEAYRWLVPPPGEHGGAMGATATLPVTGGQSPLITLATPEVPPQAQVFAAPGALTMPTGTTALTVTIQPVLPDPAAVVGPADGHVAGNVYRITITTQAGTSVTAPAASEVSIIVRAPEIAATEGTVALLVSGTWTPLKTEAEGSGAGFFAIVTMFGDFAVLEPGPGPTSAAGPSVAASPSNPAGPAASAVVPGSPSGGIPPITIVAAIATVLLLGALVALALMPRGPRRRSPPPPRRGP